MIYPILDRTSALAFKQFMDQTLVESAAYFDHMITQPVLNKILAQMQLISPQQLEHHLMAQYLRNRGVLFN